MLKRFSLCVVMICVLLIGTPVMASAGSSYSSNNYTYNSGKPYTKYKSLNKNKCSVSGCDNKKYGSSSYCKAHTCKMAGCNNRAYTEYGYCKKHKKEMQSSSSSSSSSKGGYLPSKGSSSSSSSSSSKSKTYNQYTYDPADYDDPEEFADDAEDEYGSWDAAYDAWEDY